MRCQSGPGQDLHLNPPMVPFGYSGLRVAMDEQDLRAGACSDVGCESKREREGVLPVEAMLVPAGLLRGMTVCCQILVGSFVLAHWGSSRLRGNRVQSGCRLGAHIAKVHWCTYQAKGEGIIFGHDRPSDAIKTR